MMFCVECAWLGMWADGWLMGDGRRLVRTYVRVACVCGKLNKQTMSSFVPPGLRFFFFCRVLSRASCVHVLCVFRVEVGTKEIE